ncbi:HupE/UreJ family protein [Aquisalimonas sp.]|uniref:HupE/UreJ family protein n=1 Tax=Aquisalimonas sp. TaxID=1872621 RepID=UPI0025B95DBA|nr:HupE/UreJ family protein [Aquisalimonas sp.]
MMHRRWIVVLLLVTPGLALAHPGYGHGGFVAGVSHPLLGLDHLLAMLGVGFWAARHGSLHGAIGVCAAFVAAVLGGFALGLGQSPVPAVEFGIMASLLVTGVLVFGARRLPLTVIAGLAGIFALIHGHAHGAEMAAGLSAVAFMGGFALTTGVLLAAGAGLAYLGARGSALRPVERGTGTVLVAAGTYMLVVV